jgi:hypothetical protein
MTERNNTDSDSCSDSSEAENLAEEMDDEQNEEDDHPRTKIRLKAYDLEVEAESEDASFEEMAEVLSDEFAQIRRDAMVGEYEEIEERGLHGIFIGGDR